MAQANKLVDPITIATTWHYLQRICREMRDTVERTATNVLITTLHDMAYGVWDASGRAIAIPEGFPCRPGSGAEGEIGLVFTSYSEYYRRTYGYTHAGF